MTIGVLPIGYYEGAWSLARGAYKKTGKVTIGGIFISIVGRVCMNHTMINIEGVDAKVGDKVVVYSNDWNDKNSVDTIAHDHELFNYGLLAALSSDVRRVLVD
jgi:alanine racemase